jgi:hypothetical protein
MGLFNGVRWNVPKKKFVIAVFALFLVVIMVFSGTLLYKRLDLRNRAATSTPLPGTATFFEGFDGTPSSPLPFLQTPAADRWDVLTHYRDGTGNQETPLPANAHHPMDCSKPIDDKGNLLTHPLGTTYDSNVFICNNHLMTTINGGDYGAVYLTPNHMIDFTNQEAVIRYDMSTHRSAARDWIDVFIMPYEDNLTAPLDGRPDLQGLPRRGINIEMSDRGSTTPCGTDAAGGNVNFCTIFLGRKVDNFTATYLPRNEIAYEEFLKPDPARRDFFEIRISRNHLKFWMPDYNKTFIDTDIPGGLDWSRGVVQFGHHSYNPFKDCGMTNHQGFKPCGPGTWHWGSMSLVPSVPFTMIKADKNALNLNNGPQTVTFKQPAPANAFLRFHGRANGGNEISLDGGKTWSVAKRQESSAPHTGHFMSYWQPVPQGTTSVMFRSQQPDGNYAPYVKNPSIWSSSSAGAAITQKPTTTVATVVPTSTATQSPSITKSPTPTPTHSSATSTPTPTTTAAKQTFYKGINFNGPATTINGNAWVGDGTAFIFTGSRFESQSVVLNPAVSDANLAKMIRSSIWNNGGTTIKVPNTPNGTYDVYLYVWEDNNSEKFSLYLENVLVQKDYVSGAKGAWKKLGPWRTSIKDGAIDLRASGPSAANFSGLEIWSVK